MFTLAKRTLQALLPATLLLPGLSAAADLGNAMAAARANSPALAAESARVDAAADNLDAAQGQRLPNIGLQASVGAERLEGTSSVFPFEDLTVHPEIIGLKLEQPLYTSGRISAGIEAARFGRAAREASFAATEQAVLLAAVRAYADLYRDQALLALEQNNEARLQRQLEAAQAEQRAGERTGTDVAQARARLAGARAERIAAEGALASSRASYLRMIGEEPGQLVAPQLPAHLPGSLASAIALAEQGHAIAARRAAQQMAAAQADAVDGEDGPQLALSAGVSHASEPDMIFDKRDQAAIALTFSMPLYQGGTAHAHERAARREADARALETEAALREVREQATRAWQMLLATRAQKVAIEAQIEAAQEALTGVDAAVRAGERTLLDALDAEQEALQARANAVAAERDHVVAAYTLLAATGELTLTDDNNGN